MEIPKTRKFLILFFLLAVASRFLPHPPNFAAVGALAMFAGTYEKGLTKILWPLGAMLFSDAVIGFYDFRVMFSVYGSFALISLIGWWLRREASLEKLLLASIAGSTLFYLVTNFAVWAFSTLYTKSASGLLLSYILALPFFRNTLLGDLFFVAVFFGVYALARERKNQTQFASQPILEINQITH